MIQRYTTRHDKTRAVRTGMFVIEDIAVSESRTSLTCSSCLRLISTLIDLGSVPISM